MTAAHAQQFAESGAVAAAESRASTGKKTKGGMLQPTTQKRSKCNLTVSEKSAGAKATKQICKAKAACAKGPKPTRKQSKANAGSTADATKGAGEENTKSDDADDVQHKWLLGSPTMQWQDDTDQRVVQFIQYVIDNDNTFLPSIHTPLAARSCVSNQRGKTLCQVKVGKFALCQIMGHQCSDIDRWATPLVTLAAAGCSKENLRVIKMSPLFHSLFIS